MTKVTKKVPQGRTYHVTVDPRNALRIREMFLDMFSDEAGDVGGDITVALSQSGSDK